MLDPIIFIVVVGAVSGAGVVGAGRMVLRHHVEIQRGKREPISDVLRSAFPVNVGVPEGMRDLLNRIDRRDA